MKKLGILAVLLVILITTTYSQNSGVFAMIKENEPEHIKLFKYFAERNCVYVLNAYLSGSNHDTIKYYDGHTNYVKNSFYSFVENRKLYVLSYDNVRYVTDKYPNSPQSITSNDSERDLHLFCWDGEKWSIVTNKPIQTDSYVFNDNDGWILKNYYPKKCHDGITPEYGQKVEKKENGNIEIVLANSEFIFNTMNRSKFYVETIVLVPNNDGTYYLKSKSGKKQIKSKL